MAEYMQEAMNPGRQAEEMEFVNQLLARLNQTHRPGQPNASGDSAFDTAYLGHLQLAGEAVRGVYQSLYVDREFMKKAGCLLANAKKYDTCLPEAWSVEEHVKWVGEFCGSVECKDVLKKETAEELMKKCRDMEPKAAVEEICGKIQTARQDYVGRVIKFQFGYSIFNFVVVFCECWETCSQLQQFEIHCRGYDDKLDSIVGRLREEENKLTEMAIRMNESRAITTMEIYDMLMNLTGIRQELEMLRQDLEHNKKDIKRRRNGHMSGAAAGAKNIVRRVESLTQQLRMMYSAPAAQANISARAIPSPVA
ncbi:uncharacterized protein LOC144873539 isoform X2 [Branchiostoma floridae x Branchiostoma japonicum]